MPRFERTPGERLREKLHSMPERRKKDGQRRWKNGPHSSRERAASLTVQDETDTAKTAATEAVAAEGEAVAPC